MKKIIFLLFPIITFAQKDTLSVTEKFYLVSPGAIIKKESKKVGKGKYEVILYKLTNQKTSRTLNYVSAAGIPIDMEELPGLIDAIEYMIKISDKKEATNNEEYYYFTSSNLWLTLSNNPRGILRGWHFTFGEKYYYTNSYKPGNIVNESSEFADLVENLKKVKGTNL